MNMHPSSYITYPRDIRRFGYEPNIQPNEKFPLEEIDNEGIDHYSENEFVVTDKKRTFKKIWSKIGVNE